MEKKELFIYISDRTTAMAQDGFIITKETWDATPKEQRDWILFETLCSLNDRMKRLETWNKSLSFVGGIIGGVAAMLIGKAL